MPITCSDDFEQFLSELDAGMLSLSDEFELLTFCFPP